ncbi:nuclear transport factor 2 family protein [Mycobacterium paraseoulense]|uniref:Polyketide cyclase n=1 Tax=Mycobacterium paraseoulense TaxID=590652 RepID=A0A1X0IFP5_9MYCO|nr:nuclear transport factor 2 family protein [Mycobacterium paraseoulense]MCV7393703.1 nuclear transport factor 2 family protein [Mycobacterium paraseoulense]ORB45543.1 polyketide cyclase [Mycobacterium paraseoulense]BBZ70681.1 polyketide cyclase [Mycobacterium paraseoulense]
MSRMTIEDRLRRIEDTLEIQQLPIRYAMAIDDRDVDAWVELFVPDVRVGRDRYGRDALRDALVSMVSQFYRSMHQIVGHRVELLDDTHAVGNVYCRAEHEVGARWIVMAIRYDDEYQRVDGRWLFTRRRENHWYAADHIERPQAVAFEGWSVAGAPNLPRATSWTDFWAGVDTSQLTSQPVAPGVKAK